MTTPFLVVIPARMASTRLPRKPLSLIGGLPMIVRVAQQAKKSAASRVIIATDSDEIVAVAHEHQLEVLLTKSSHPTGTDRLSEVAHQLGLPPDEIVVNVQGDEPFIPPEIINEVANTLANHPKSHLATAAIAISNEEEIHNPNVVKVVLNQQGCAMYFSRAVIPFTRDPQLITNDTFRYLRHIGIYAYKASFLQEFSLLLPAPPEKLEALEQLRALWYGYSIQVFISKEAPPPGVDTPEDLAHAQAIWEKLNVR
ncbi:MAG: 3-deoxy-manno-octulosonate cytidylyltransferase [Betaproteobacteria bacterium]|jgi:3-deoxy-manno-octulosonate cytidylyltransferase (CMP-KDO synthetase)